MGATWAHGKVVAILRKAGVEVVVLKTDETKLKPEQKEKLADRRAKLEAALEEVEKSLGSVKVG
jgi:hypothetical protein